LQIDGTASVGAGVVQEVVPLIHTYTNSWDNVFVLLMTLSGVAVVLLGRLFVVDVRRLHHRIRLVNTSDNSIRVTPLAPTKSRSLWTPWSRNTYMSHVRDSTPSAVLHW
jgi:hypothetical protein